LNSGLDHIDRTLCLVSNWHPQVGVKGLNSTLHKYDGNMASDHTACSRRWSRCSRREVSWNQRYCPSPESFVLFRQCLLPRFGVRGVDPVHNTDWITQYDTHTRCIL